jgi:hypothetical protein
VISIGEDRKLKISTSNYTGKRITIISQRPFEEVVASLDSLIAHPDVRQLLANMRNANSGDELTRVVREAVGEPELMEFLRFDLGDVLKKRFGPQACRSLRILVGNPVTMSSMATHVPDAGSYAPVTILIDERTDGIHLTYDAMESYLNTYANEAALKVARELDRKVLSILENAAQ